MAKKAQAEAKVRPEEIAIGVDQTGKIEHLRISPPKFEQAQLRLVGTSPYMQARFSEKAKQAMADKMKEGSLSQKRGRTRKKRDFNADYEAARYRLPGDRYGIPASAYRAAGISACRLVGFKMTLAKLCLFVMPDGLDEIDATPLVELFGEPEQNQMTVRNATGVADIRVRPLWREWSALVRVRYDTEQFDRSDIVNLFMRVGEQVGIGEGRPDSRDSYGLGYGLFRIE